jgi:hypothetical protein
MKKLLLLLSILAFSTTSSYACSCVSSFLRVLNHEKTTVVADYLNTYEENIKSIKVLNTKDRKSFLDVALGVVFFPFSIAAGECERSCSSVKRAGTVTFLVQYLNSEEQVCDKVIRVKGRVTNYETLRMKNKFVSFGESCEKAGKSY